MKQRRVNAQQQLGDACRQMMASLSNLGDLADASNSAVSRLRTHLLNTIHPLLHTFDMMPRVYNAAERRRLCSSARLGVLRLEDAVEKISILTGAAAGDVQAEPSFCSLRSLTHESMIYAESLWPNSAAKYRYPLPPAEDFVVIVDAPKLVHLLSTCFSSVACHPRTREIVVCVEACHHEHAVTVKWRISNGGPSISAHHEDLALADDPDLALRRSSFDRLFLDTVSHLLSSKVGRGLGGELEVLSQLPLIRKINRLSEATLGSVTILGSEQDTLAHK